MYRGSIRNVGGMLPVFGAASGTKWNILREVFKGSFESYRLYLSCLHKFVLVTLK